VIWAKDEYLIAVWTVSHSGGPSEVRSRSRRTTSPSSVATTFPTQASPCTTHQGRPAGKCAHRSRSSARCSRSQSRSLGDAVLAASILASRRTNGSNGPLHSGQSARTTNSLTTIRRQVPDLVPSDRACHRPGRRRAAGSLSAWYRTSPSSETLAYLVRLRTDACPDNFINTGVDAPSSAACVSRECRN